MNEKVIILPGGSTIMFLLGSKSHLYILFGINPLQVEEGYKEGHENNIRRESQTTAPDIRESQTTAPDIHESQTTVPDRRESQTTAPDIF